MTMTLMPAVVATNMCRVWIGDIDGLLAVLFRDGAVLFGCVHIVVPLLVELMMC